MGSRKAKQNELVYIPFTVFGTDGITPLTGQAGSCSYNLTLNNANAPESVTLAEIGSTGYYYASVTLLSLGSYDLEIACPDNRVLGEVLFVEANDLDDIKGDTAAVKLVTDSLPNSGALTDIDTGVNNIEAKLPTNFIMGSPDADDKLTIIPEIMNPNSIDLSSNQVVLGMSLSTNRGSIPASGEITPGTITIFRKAKGGPTWVIVTVGAACLASNGMIIYTEAFDAAGGYAEGDSIYYIFFGQKVTINGVDYELSAATGSKFGQTYIRETGVMEMNAKLPTNYIMGSPDANDKLTIIPIPVSPNTTDLADTANVLLGISLITNRGSVPTSAEITSPGTFTIFRKPKGATAQIPVISGQACLKSDGLVFGLEVFDSGTGYAEGDSIMTLIQGVEVTINGQVYEVCGASGITHYTYIRETGVMEMNAKLPTNYIMGSSDQTDKDDEIDAIKAKTDLLPSGIPKNVALSNFDFVMLSSTDHITQSPGLTVSGTIKKDGGSFVALTNSVSEVGTGIYTVDFTQDEMNADIITLRFTATGADPRVIVIKTDT